MQYFFSFSSLLKYIVMMTQEGSTKIVNLMTPRGRGFCAKRLEGWGARGRGLRLCIVSIYSKLNAFILRGYKAAFLCHYLFLFILDGSVDMQIWALLTRSQILRWLLRPIGHWNTTFSNSWFSTREFINYHTYIYHICREMLVACDFYHNIHM